MKAGWEEKKLARICTIDRNQAIHSGLPYVGMEDIEAGTGRFIGRLGNQTVKSSTFRFTPRHVLYGRLRPYLNKVLLPEFEGHCSTEILPLLPSERISNRFLAYWLMRDETVTAINATCTGARMPRANMDEVFDFHLLVPNIQEQQRIVTILDEAFEGIATAKANAEKNLQNARELFESQLESVFTRGGPGWLNSTIGRHIQFIDYRGKTPVKTATGLRLITAKNVKMGFLQESPMEFIDPDGYEAWMTRGIPRMGDVLFTTEAPLANVALLDTDEKVAFAQRIIIMQPDASVLDGAFLKYLLISRPVQQRIHAKGTGATVKGIKASLLRTIEISFPQKVTVQREIVTMLDSLSNEIQRLESIYQQKTSALDELKQTLLHRAFNGDL